jgi:hypothetical protein
VSVRNFAYAYRDGGWSVVGLWAKDRPAVPWKELQRRPPTDIELDTWYPPEGGGCPGVAIITGKLSGLTVLDFDGPTAALTVDELAPGAAIARTPSGGAHAFYRWSGERNAVRVQRFSDGGGIDVRGDGGYVVAAPSSFASGGYAWVRLPRGPLPSLPLWALHALAHDEDQPTNGRARVRRRGGGAILGGERHDTLVAIAGGMVKRGCSTTDVEAELRDVNASRCSPPMTDAELRTELRGILSATVRWS